MKTWHPDSWSKQARELADTIYSQYLDGSRSLEDAENFFSNSYRNPLERRRAAKRFGRLLRKNKNKEE